MEIEADLLVNDPADGLIAASRRVDMLVMGSRALGPKRAVLLGSVSRKVVAGAACPVLVLPRGAEQRRTRADALLAITAAVLIGVGLALVGWYAVWGVHGCDQSQATCDRMDRDLVINAIGLGSIALGLVWRLRLRFLSETSGATAGGESAGWSECDSRRSR